MTAYVVCMLVAWPLVRTATSLPWKVLLALLPIVPMLYVIGLMARRIRDSDELEQRTHLIALGLSTAIVGALSLIGGFLASAQVLRLDGTILIWVFPVQMICYDVTRWRVARRYGMSLACDDEGGMLQPLYLLLVGVLLAAIALYARWRHDQEGFGLSCGMAVAFVVGALALWLRRRQMGHRVRED